MNEIQVEIEKYKFIRGFVMGFLNYFFMGFLYIY
jgi:hypothetical protein